MKIRTIGILSPFLLLFIAVMLYSHYSSKIDVRLVNSTWILREVKSNEFNKIFIEIDSIPYFMRIKLKMNKIIRQINGNSYTGDYKISNFNLINIPEFGIPCGLSFLKNASKQQLELNNQRDNWLLMALGGDHYYQILNQKLIIYLYNGELIFIKDKSKFIF